MESIVILCTDNKKIGTMSYSVKTKYDIGDLVWLILQNKAHQGKITGYKVSVDESMNAEITYTLFSDDKRPECMLFKTKEELLKSL